ncbi:MAG: hypothetical protein ABI834_08080 [Ginsengibacter sp.]
MKEIFSKFLNVIVLFIFINVVVFIFKEFLQLHGFEIEFLLIANLVLFALSFSGFFIQMKALKSNNINAFIRGVYSSLILKIFIVIISLSIYLFIIRGKINKPSLFTSMGFYLLYTSIEVIQLMKFAHRKPNA